jgi:uncharacterized membrane protein (DUF373 family)
MGIKLVHLSQFLLKGTDFSLVVDDILFILVLVELFRLLLITWRNIAFRWRPAFSCWATLKEVLTVHDNG